MVLSVSTRKIPVTDATGIRSRDRLTSSTVPKPLCYPRPHIYIYIYIYILVALYLLLGLYTFEDRKVMEVVLACFKGTVPATGWRDWGKLNTSVSVTNLYANIQIHDLLDKKELFWLHLKMQTGKGRVLFWTPKVKNIKDNVTSCVSDQTDINKKCANTRITQRIFEDS